MRQIKRVKKNPDVYSHFLNMTRNPLHTIKLQEVRDIQFSGFRYRYTIFVGFVSPKIDFQKSPFSCLRLCGSVGCLAASRP